MLIDVLTRQECLLITHLDDTLTFSSVLLFDAFHDL